MVKRVPTSAQKIDMITLTTCPLKQTYYISEIKEDVESKKHLQHLGLVKNARVTVMNRDKSNGVVLIHNSRIALDNAILSNIELSKKVVGHESLDKLANIKPGQMVMVLHITTNAENAEDKALKRRLLDMGVTRGTRIFVRKVAPLGDPMELHVRGYELTLRKSEAEKVEVSVLEDD